MPKRKKTRKTPKRRKAPSRKTNNKPIGFTKVKGKFVFVFGTKKKPRLGKSRFSKKKTLNDAFKSGKAK